MIKPGTLTYMLIVSGILSIIGKNRKTGKIICNQEK